MTSDDYHNDTSRISKSGLDLIARSPAHYWQAKLAPPEQRVKKEKKAFDIGTALHTLLLEPEDFPNRVAVIPEVDLRTRDGRKRMMELNDHHAGKLMLTAEECVAVQRMRDAVMRHPTAQTLLTGALLVEHTLEWTDPMTGALCKARMDAMNVDLEMLVDVKTSEDASPTEFAKSVARYRYHVQEAFYADGYAQVTGQQLPFLFIVVEKEPPFGVAVYELEKEARVIGRALYQRDLETYMRCLGTGEWPAYSKDVQLLTLPAWAKKI